MSFILEMSLGSELGASSILAGGGGRWVTNVLSAQIWCCSCRVLEEMRVNVEGQSHLLVFFFFYFLLFKFYYAIMRHGHLKKR